MPRLFRGCRRLGGASLVGGVETIGRPGTGSRCLNLTIARRSIRDKRIEQLVRGFGYLVNRPAERDLVCFGGPGEAAQLPDELQGRGKDLLVRGRRSEVMKGFDVSTHNKSSSPPGRRIGNPACRPASRRTVAQDWRRDQPIAQRFAANLILQAAPRASDPKNDPYVWTGCSSQVRACSRKSLICIRPVDRRAGRGLDGNTHAPLISLAERPPSGHLGHQIQGAFIDPFHAVPQSRTGRRPRLDRRGLEVGIEGLVVAQDAPGDAGQLVGQRDGELVPVQPLGCRFEPGAEAEPGPVVAAASGGPSRPGSNRVRRYLLPRLEMRPRIDRPPVLYCRGTRPSQAPKSRPRSKASPVPMAATIAVEISGPMPGTLISRRQLASFWPISSISPVTVAMRSSSRHQSS